MNFEDTLRGYRGALYMGIGLASLGVLTAMTFVWKRNHDQKLEQRREELKEASD
jgi:hypothetical protein